jgi:uncharacterized protein
MLSAGKAVKVSIYLSDGATRHGVPVYSSILDFLFFRGIAGATVFKGVAGFGADHHMHASSSVEISDRLPIKIEFIETRQKIEEILGKLEELVGGGLIEMQETIIAKPAQVSKPRNLAPPAHFKIEGRAKMMRIYLSEDERWKDQPLHEALVMAMRANDIAGVTVYRGILGYGARSRQEKEKPQHGSHHGTVMLSAIDTDEKLRGFLPLVDEMVAEGLVVFSDVDVIKYAYRALEVEGGAEAAERGSVSE